LGTEVDVRSGGRILADDIASGKVILPDLAMPDSILLGSRTELRPPMDVWFYSRIGTAAERPTRALNEKRITLALLPSASGDLFAS
jgi:hypothetical protein